MKHQILRTRPERHAPRKSQRPYQHAASHHETRDRSRNPNIEQRRTRADRGTNPDERSHRPNQRRKWNKERQGCVYAITNAIKVMSHLVRQQDQHQRSREGNPLDQPRRMLQHSFKRRKQWDLVVFQGKRREALIEIPLHVRAHRQRSEDGCQQQYCVQPVALFGPAHQYMHRRVVVQRGRGKAWSWFSHRNY